MRYGTHELVPATPGYAQCLTCSLIGPHPGPRTIPHPDGVWAQPCAAKKREASRGDVPASYRLFPAGDGTPARAPGVQGDPYSGMELRNEDGDAILHFCIRDGTVEVRAPGHPWYRVHQETGEIRPLRKGGDDE